MPSNLSNAQSARATMHLDALIRNNGVVMTRRQRVTLLMQRSGVLCLDTHNKHEYNKHKYNRMDAAAQAAYDKRLSLKQPFTVEYDGPDACVATLTKIEADYFREIGGKLKVTAPNDAS